MRRFWPRFGIGRLMAVIGMIAIVFVSLRFASVEWAGIVLLMTAGELCRAILMVYYRRGESRAFWLGFTLFGSAYMGLTSETWWLSDFRQFELPTSRALDGIMPYLDPAQPPRSPWWGNRLVGSRTTGFFAGLIRDPDTLARRFRTALEQPIPMPFREETTLEDVLKHIRISTARPDFPSGIPIYVDPVGLQEAEKTMTSAIRTDADIIGVPLRTSLKLILKQLDLTYSVRDGVLTITAVSDDPPFEPEAFQRIGHCWFVWIVGLLGGVVGVYVHSVGARRERDEVAGV